MSHLAFHAIGQEAGDDDTLDLRGPFIDLNRQRMFVL